MVPVEDLQSETGPAHGPGDAADPHHTARAGPSHGLPPCCDAFLPVAIVAWWPGLWLVGRPVARICVTGDAGSLRAAVAGGVISLRDDGLVRCRPETRPGRVPAWLRGRGAGSGLLAGRVVACGGGGLASLQAAAAGE